MTIKLKRSRSQQFVRSKKVKKKSQQELDHKQDLEDFLKKRTRTLMWLCKHYPKCFSIEHPVPLKIGIIRDIYEILPEAISRTIIRKVLRRYTRTKRYLDALLSNPHRFSLEGDVVGDVSDKERDIARKTLDTYEGL